MAGAFGRRIAGLVALLLGPNQERLDWLNGRAGPDLRLRFPLSLRCGVARFGLRRHLGNQVSFTLLSQLLVFFLALLHFLAQAGFELVKSGLGIGLASAQSLFVLGLQL